jgi:hypothetical protein
MRRIPRLVMERRMERARWLNCSMGKTGHQDGPISLGWSCSRIPATLIDRFFSLSTLQPGSERHRYRIDRSRHASKSQQPSLSTQLLQRSQLRGFVVTQSLGCQEKSKILLMILRGMRENEIVQNFIDRYKNQKGDTSNDVHDGHKFSRISYI